MKIIELEITNFKGIKAFSYSPDNDTNVIELVGKNGQGKTSVLDAIWAVLAGGASQTTKQPIREGEKSATIRIDLGEYIVTRHWPKNESSTLTVESPRGAKYGSPQKILDGLIGQFAFDPLAFMKQSARDQVATLVNMLGEDLGFSPALMETKRAEVFASRAEANRDVKSLTARLAALPQTPADTPDREVAIADLLAEARSITAHNDQVRGLEKAAVRGRQARESAELAVAQAEESLKFNQGNLAELKESEAVAATAAAAAEVKSTDDVDAKLASIDAVNANVRAKFEAARLAAALAAAEATANGYTAALNDIATAKKAALAAVVLPVAELSFNDDGPTYNGIPLNQASGAEQLRVSVALAMAMNPELRVLRIDGAEALDSDGFKLIRDLADTADYQCWLSVVSEDEDRGITIYEGTRKNA